jgi:5-methylcytosine-specific restriction protein A
MKLNQDPLCEECRANNRLVAASIVHHHVDLRVDGDRALEMENLVSLCAACHNQLHKKQA